MGFKKFQACFVNLSIWIRGSFINVNCVTETLRQSCSTFITLMNISIPDLEYAYVEWT